MQITLTCQGSMDDLPRIINPLCNLRKEDGFIGEIRADFGGNTMVFHADDENDFMLEIVSNERESQELSSMDGELQSLGWLSCRRHGVGSGYDAVQAVMLAGIAWFEKLRHPYFRTWPPVREISHWTTSTEWGSTSSKQCALAAELAGVMRQLTGGWKKTPTVFKITLMCQFPMDDLPNVLDPLFVLREKMGFIGEIRTDTKVFPADG